MELQISGNGLQNLPKEKNMELFFIYITLGICVATAIRLAEKEKMRVAFLLLCVLCWPLVLVIWLIAILNEAKI